MSLTLKYWNGRGLAEIPRMLLAIAGKFPGDYVDGRFDSPPEGLEANVGRMPVLQVDSDSIGQSAAINYYIAAEHGLLGSSNLEAAKIIALSEHVKEMLASYKTVVPYGVEPTDEMLDKWFTGGSVDVTGTAARDGQSTRYATWWMSRIETILDSNGFAIGSKISYADVLMYFVFAEELKESEANNVPPFRRVPFGSKERTIEALAKYPKIANSCKVVAENANMQKWLSIRGVQAF